MKNKAFESDIKKFRELFQIGLSAIKEAARVYVVALDRDFSAKQAFREAIPEVPYMTWATIERVGRGQLHEKLLLGGGRAQAAMRTLSLSEQTEALEHGVKMLLHDGTIMQIFPDDMTSSQVSQVFHNGTIRGIDAQRAWMEMQKEYRLSAPMRCKERYKIEGNRLVVLTPAIFSKRELKQVLCRMESAK